MGHSLFNPYEYGKDFRKSRGNCHPPKVPSCHLNQDGEVLWYEAGSMEELRQSISKAVSTKETKAARRLERRPELVRLDLGLLIQDDGALGIGDIKTYLPEYEESSFTRIFFITREKVFVFQKGKTIQEVKRKYDPHYIDNIVLE